MVQFPWRAAGFDAELKWLANNIVTLTPMTEFKTEAHEKSETE
jgi:hypothetical protein